MYRRQVLIGAVAGVTSGCLRLIEGGSGSESGSGGSGSGSSSSFEIRYADEDVSLQMVLDRDGVAAAGRPQEQRDGEGIQSV